MPRVLLVTPPLTQLNTPYPATAYLTGLLASRGVSASQADLSLETALALFSRDGLGRLFAAIRGGAGWAPEVGHFLDREASYLETVDRVVAFLQGRDPTLATRICRGDLLPAGPRFGADEIDLDQAFGTLGLLDRARHFATLYLYDLADLAQHTVAPRFGLSRYGEALASSATSFDPLAAALAEPPGLIERLLEEVLAPHMERVRPSLVGLTVPFPGNLYGALRIAQAIRRDHPAVRIALGGGFVNTELRQLDEPRLFDLVDYVLLDDGERPLLALCDHLAGGRPEARLARTFVRRDGQVAFVDGAGEPDLAQAELPAPSYRGLPLDRYLSVSELGNPMHRLWSDGRWSKLTVAHGCYWKRCTFCDVGLDYIARYDPLQARDLCDRMDRLVADTGESGFHFVDEAAPPLGLCELALELLARGRCVSFWGNIRFEKTFTVDVCRLLARAGCIAVSGGLEVASDRLLALIEKGVTVAQVARVASAFAEAGVMVHAYLMYGFPTETAQETIDSLERVRQLFAAGALDSAFWHRFTLTRHSPIARDPAAFGITVAGPPLGRFANNDLIHADPTGCDPGRLSDGLRRAVFNYMHGLGLERDVRTWFAHKTPRARVSPDFIATALAGRAAADPTRPDARLVWLGGSVRLALGRRPGLEIVGPGDHRFVVVSAKVAAWAAEVLSGATPLGRGDRPYLRKPEAAAAFPGGGEAFARFTSSAAWAQLHEAGLIEIP
ncbi:MAG: radical SAM protein [Myxococcales bacterium]|nr:radical SAM protein [Myxococcales bacterium]